jgi:hypothetical protein
MTGQTKNTQEKKHAKIDKAIEDSIQPTAANLQDLAEQTDEHPSLIRRRMDYLGLEWRGRWVYRHSKDKK